MGFEVSGVEGEDIGLEEGVMGTMVEGIWVDDIGADDIGMGEEGIGGIEGRVWVIA